MVGDRTQDAIAKYEAAIADHPEQGPLADEAWLAPNFSLASLENCAPGTPGQAWRSFMVGNDLVEDLAAGYHARHEELLQGGKLDRLPPILAYKVIRGFQIHDLHHVLTGYPASPFGELSLQAFQLAQVDFPYSAMWIAVVAGHMTLVDPHLIKPAMDAITDGWAFGRASRSIKFVRFEEMIDKPLEGVRASYGLNRSEIRVIEIPEFKRPELLVA